MTTIEVHPTGIPAARLPMGLVYDVRQVLLEHGLDAEPVEILMACSRLADVTPADRGGRA